MFRKNMQQCFRIKLMGLIKCKEDMILMSLTPKFCVRCDRKIMMENERRIQDAFVNLY